VPLLLRDAGFRADVERGYIPGPRTLGYNFWGSAAVDASVRGG
jgi:hypothetical protein